MKKGSGPGGSGEALPPPLPPPVGRRGQHAVAPGLAPATGSENQRGQWYLAAVGVIVGLALALLLLTTNVLQVVTGASPSRSQATDSKQTDH
jgi:hypothetical protein